MNIQNRIDLSRVRMDNAVDCLETAKSLFELKKYNAAANRSYYAVYNAIRSVLAFDGIDRKHHSGTINEFRRLYISNNTFPNDFSDYIGELFVQRNKSDYDDFYIIDKECVDTQIKNAEKIISAIQSYNKDRENSISSDNDEQDIDCYDYSEEDYSKGR